MELVKNLLVVVHVVADTVWIGSILSVAGLLLAPSSAPGDSRTRAELAYRLYRTIATPAFVVAFMTGIGRLALDPRLYFVVTKFMHVKLTLALVVIALHHVIGAGAKKAVRGGAPQGALKPIALSLLAAATGVVYLAVLKPF